HTLIYTCLWFPHPLPLRSLFGSCYTFSIIKSNVILLVRGGCEVESNWSVLCVFACPPGPMASMEHGRELEEASTVRKMVQQSPARGGQTHRPAGWKRRRPRPRLSHKGPMPF
ncbi:apelin, partial [Seriola lalandi dorsalis]|uniref:apelin n=1 Tax=Seriola lalandi dorsalis TaxID=1841481 RepID=UPI000C6F7CD4